MLIVTTSSIIQLPEQRFRVLCRMLFKYGVVETSLDGNEIISKVDYLWFLIWLPFGPALSDRTLNLS